MSADNFMAVLKEGDKYVGYHCSASVACEVPGWKKCYKCIGSKDFSANSLEEAVCACESFSYLEYGYRFVDNHPMEMPEEGFCEICAHSPNLPDEGSEEAKEQGCNCEKIGPGFKMGKDCPVHANIRWQEKVGFGDE